MADPTPHAAALCASPLGLGCARLGGVFGGTTDGYLRLVDAALEAGVTFFDTADMYTQGESERLLGRALARRREGVILATKGGFVLPARRHLADLVKPVLRPLVRRLGLRRKHVPGAVRGALAQDFSPAHLRRALEGSLKRLRTDHVDLFQLHSPPAEEIARGAWREAVEAFVREGKARHWGISVDTLEAGRLALEQPGLASLQLLANPLDPELVLELGPAAAARGVVVIAREVLANGLLAKEAGEADVAANTRSAGEAARKTAEIARLRAEAARAGERLPDLALRWVRERPGVTVTLLGARNAEQLRGLLGGGRARGTAA